MVADAAVDSTDGFGTVSQLRGTVFKYISFGAAVIGLVVLAALLAAVVIDAFGLDKAGPGWFVAYGLTVGLPIIGFGWYGTRHPPFGRVALRFVVVIIAGVFALAGLAVLFVIINPQLWFLAYSLVLLPAVGVYLVGHRREDHRTPFVVAAVVLVGLGLTATAWYRVTTYPVDWLIHVWTFAVPMGAVVGMTAGRVVGRRAAGVVGLGIIASAWLVGYGLALVPLVDSSVGVLVYVTVVVPVAGVVGRTLVSRETGRAGLLAPVAIVTGALLGRVLVDLGGVAKPVPWLDWQFLTSPPSRFPEQAGLFPAIIGSVFVIALVAVFSFVLGVGAAVYLEEYAPETGVLGAVTRIIRVNISNLAGVPSVVYGLLGLGMFVNLLGMGFGTVLVAALTLSLLILPIVIISASEALRAVPDEQRQASFGMGATRWQTIRNVLLPRAMPGILTGTILSLSRAIGETAPLLMIGAPTTVFAAPTGITSKASAMPLQVFEWTFAAKPGLRTMVAPAGVLTLLFVLLAMNSVAVVLRNKYERST